MISGGTKVPDGGPSSSSISPVPAGPGASAAALAGTDASRLCHGHARMGSGSAARGGRGSFGPTRITCAAGPAPPPAGWPGPRPLSNVSP